MHERLLSEAAWPSPKVVMGMLLRPYSLGHELRLTALNNPLADVDSGTAENIAEAVLICSQSWREAEKMPFDSLLGLKLWLWRWRAHKLDFRAEIKKFVEYRKAGTVEFPISDVPEASRSPSRIPGCPFLLRLHQWLMLHLRLSEAEAWDYPYGLAKCRWACYWEQEAGLKIYNAHDEEFDAFVLEQEKKGAEQCRH